ncbi:MAG: DUF5684 domain-containing protein [Cyclobacteriaceae bacterium]|jgi:uncharacterized membrane protein YhaH (DUF805 family)|nr:DUF5684 domain-containing protein [Cyclobacteriaceae bacterium]
MQDYNMDSDTAAGVGLFTLLVYLALLIVTVAGVWKTFEKAGKPGWAAIVPIYNIIIMLEIVGKPTWWVVLIFVPLVNLVILIILYHQMSLSFGRGVGMTVLLILLPFVGWPMLGFGDAQYQGPAGAAVTTA